MQTHHLARTFPRVTPPRFARHFISWGMLWWLNDRLPTCWANMVMWKNGYEAYEWWPSEGCFHPYDYCGKFQERLDAGETPAEIVASAWGE